VLRLEFGGEDGNLCRVGWEGWFTTFDATASISSIRNSAPTKPVQVLPVWKT
jgi:hypothetical protein